MSVVWQGSAPSPQSPPAPLPKVMGHGVGSLPVTEVADVGF